MRTTAIAILTGLFSIFILSGCTKEPPKCSDERTLNLVISIISNQISKEIGLSTDDLKSSLKFEFAKATSYDEKIKKYSCDATLVASETYKVPVDYESQLDDNDEHIVSLSKILPSEIIQVGQTLNNAINLKNGPSKDIDKAMLKSSPALETLLGSIYEKYSEKNKCWIALDRENNQKYCMKIDKIDKVIAGTQNRIYAILSGDAIDDEGEEESFHVLSGMIGAFVIEDIEGQLSILSSSPQIPMGSYGSAPGGWELSKIGNDNYYGWKNTTGDCHQGYCGSYYVLLAPYGKRVKDIAGIVSGYSNTGNCSELCKPTSLEAKLEFDITNTTGKVFPLIDTVRGSDARKTVKKKRWVLSLNEKKWEYKTPKDYILNNRDF